MKAILGEEQQLVVETAERMAANGLAEAQAVLSGAAWPDEPDRSLMADWTGLAIPEANGGAGGGLVDLALVVRALSTNLTPTRYIDHTMALQLALTAGLPLAGGLNGSERWCLAAAEPGAPPFGPYVTAASNDRINGRKSGVPLGEVADLAVVLLADDQAALAEPTTREPAAAADLLARSADLLFEDCPATVASGSVRAGLLRASAILAAELSGVAQGAVDLGAAYAAEREQFGKPIGAFQGVAHQLSDAQVSAETAWSLTLYACWSIETGHADAIKAVHAAKAKAAEAAVFCAERALHVHGGMGMTWEAAPHLYLRRALTRGAWFGGTHWHRRQLGSALLGQTAAGASLAPDSG
jgi:alkylation response protein AidB-like acyl-CoA dehydrogenase